MNSSRRNRVPKSDDAPEVKESRILLVFLARGVYNKAPSARGDGRSRGWKGHSLF